MISVHLLNQVGSCIMHYIRCSDYLYVRMSALISVNLFEAVNANDEGITVDGVKVRKTDENPPRVSIHDLIEAILGQKDRKVWERLEESNPQVVALNHHFKFKGQGQRPTPVTDAKGVVMILNLLPGHRAAQFRLKCADVIVRYLGGDMSLINEIKTINEAQNSSPENSPMTFFAQSIDIPKVKSVTNIIDMRAPQFYIRLVEGKWSNVHPIGRPDLALSAEELGKSIVLKIGHQGESTGRQTQHIAVFKNSKVLDSFLTPSHALVEQKAKDYWKNNLELYEGSYDEKNIRDTELLVIKSQEQYMSYVHYIQRLINSLETSIELKLEMEKTKQAELEVQRVEIESEVRKAELQAQVEMKRIEYDMLKLQIENKIVPNNKDIQKPQGSTKNLAKFFVFTRNKGDFIPVTKLSSIIKANTLPKKEVKQEVFKANGVYEDVIKVNGNKSLRVWRCIKEMTQSQNA
jgi:hypothetical protein